MPTSEVAGVATEPGLDEFQVFHQEIAEGSAAGKNGTGGEHSLLFDHVDLRVSLLLRFDEFVGLVEARVFKIMFAWRDAGNAERTKLHPHCLRVCGRWVKVGVERET